MSVVFRCKNVKRNCSGYGQKSYCTYTRFKVGPKERVDLHYFLTLTMLFSTLWDSLPSTPQEKHLNSKFAVWPIISKKKATIVKKYLKKRSKRFEKQKLEPLLSHANFQLNVAQVNSSNMQVSKVVEAKQLKLSEISQKPLRSKMKTRCYVGHCRSLWYLTWNKRNQPNSAKVRRDRKWNRHFT